MPKTSSQKAALPQKTFGKYHKPLTKLPDLVENQIHSYKDLIDRGIVEIFREFSPITDYSERKFDLEFISFDLSEPKYDEVYAKENKLTYEAPLRARVKLSNKILNTVKEQEIFMADFPLMTIHGTFIINGVERVVVPQLARSFGVFFDSEETKGKRYFGAKIIPSRGVWIELGTEPDGGIYVRVDKKRKFSVIALLRVLGFTSDEQIKAAFADKEIAGPLMATLVERDEVKTLHDAYIEIYKRLRDGDLATPENAKEYIDSIVSPERYDLSPVGRFRFNKRFGKSIDQKDKDAQRRTLSKEDMVEIINHMVELNNNPNAEEDDIDHLGSRRVRYVGEMMSQKIRTGMMQMKRNIQDKMSVIDTDTTLPITIINQRPLQARIKEFFTTNQLSQFMNQENLLAEVEHLRTLSALGPGGLTRERAGFEVRDVHTSHYGRVCPIHTPEGPNIGLILRLSNYARINEFGIIETPYVKVNKGVITKEIVYMNALEEERYVIAHAGNNYDKDGKFIENEIEIRRVGQPGLAPRDEVDFIDVATNQAFSVATSMIPFLEHDDANRALMGSNMQKQAVPLMIPEAPLVATGMEGEAAKHIGRLVISEEDGEVKFVDAKKIVIKSDGKKEKEYNLINFARTNAFNLFHQRPIVSLGDTVKKGQVLADAATSDNGQIALGHNIRVAFMAWNGSNYEDAIILSEKLVRESKFSSIHIEEFICNVRDTKLGPEITTHDIPNVGENKLKNLDEDGIIRIGAEIRPGDILVGKITPKGETELTPEERLLRSIFGEKVRDVKDSSLRLDNGKRGRVIGVKVFSRERGDQLESGIIKRVHIEVAQVRNISVGDKLAGRHGNKGVISTILPVEEMPFDKDGNPIDIILTPLGVPSRMNLGQILEMHLGLAAETLGYQAIVPSFQGASDAEIKEELTKAGFDPSGTMQLYDGRTGEAFEDKSAVGIMYILKLHHMVEDKIHMRSIGPYSLITQQPLGGKAQGGGQRFGEMEVWALEGYGASHILREMLTVKSDDIEGRSQAFDSIIKGEDVREPNTPASFTVMLNTLRGLGLDVIPRKIEGSNETLIGETNL
ncbi:MAG: DNA-directed RNA polymerase subunit beta [Candidatus Pacebacteria bacterium]|nr:DNA-directed RNA polymerase subunit beta [Candidatus Paceibacterota bacterium]